MAKNYYITTPIYYVNDKPHIGHIYTNLACDILARFKRLDGYNVLFLTGTDEHGQKVEKSAVEKAMKPQDLVDKFSQYFRDLKPLLQLTNDDFIRTSEERHKNAVQAIWEKLEENGFIYKGKYCGWYALRDEAFYSEDEIIRRDDGVLIAPSGAELEWKEEDSYFFKLSHFQNQLLEFYDQNPSFIAPKSRFNEVYSFVKGGLKDLSISRSSFSWGIPTPKDNSHVIYVWLDALTNYISALEYPNLNSEKFKNFWCEAIHMVGKDIIRFHAVYWPAFLMGAGLELPKRIFAHGWWLNEGEKISKSLGNIIDPHDLLDKYGLDAVRYFLFREISFGNDGDFSHASMVSRINNDLANGLGNLLQRTSSILHKHFNGQIPTYDLDQDQIDYIKKVTLELVNLRDIIDNQDFSRYLDKVWEFVKYGNIYINDKAPWILLKEGKTEEVGKILTFILEIIRIIAIYLNPFMPLSSQNILSQLNCLPNKLSFEDIDKRFSPFHKIEPPKPIFSKILVE